MDIKYGHEFIPPQAISNEEAELRQWQASGLPDNLQKLIEKFLQNPEALTSSEKIKLTKEKISGRAHKKIPMLPLRLKR